MNKKFITSVAAMALPIFAMAQGAGYDKTSMDLSVRPGNDFAQYATGTWLKNHPLDGEHVMNGAFSDLYDLNEKQIQELILQFANTPQEKGSLGQKIGTLYNQMMDSVRMNKEGYTPIKKELERVRAIKDRREYQLVVAQIDRRGGNTCMFGWGIDADLYDSDNNIVQIGQGGLGIREPEYYFNDDAQSKTIVDAYKEYNTKLFTLVGYSQEEAEKKVEAMFAIEKRIAAVSYSRLKRRDLANNYHKMSYMELCTQFPGIDWGNLFFLTGFPTISYVDVNQPEPIHEVEKILAEVSLDDLKSYAEARIISNAADYLGDDFHNAGFEYSKKVSGVMEDSPRWKRATGLVNGMMSNAIGQMYCQKYFPESSKTRVLQLVRNLQKALAQRIDEAAWMSAETKEKAKDKLNSFTVKIGYPDKWRDYSKLEISDSLPLVQNLANMSEFFWLDMLERKCNKPVDKSEWHMSPQTINAYYNPTTNEICFPAGILQPPFFDANADDALNYGAIGGVIGHEMSHGFDDQGCQFDKTGNMVNWWTEADKANYDKRTKVLVDHFSSIEVINGKKVNGKMTLGENIGDNGGLNIALRAMHNAGINATIDGLTADQRFFLAWARVWASNVRPEIMERLVNEDVHSPNVVRVNGALPQIDEWYTAFGIKKGDKLYIPKNKRARVW